MLNCSEYLLIILLIPAMSVVLSPVVCLILVICVLYLCQASVNFLQPFKDQLFVPLIFFCFFCVCGCGCINCHCFLLSVLFPSVCFRFILLFFWLQLHWDQIIDLRLFSFLIHTFSSVNFPQYYFSYTTQILMLYFHFHSIHCIFYFT